MSIETRDQPPAGKIVLTYEDYCALPDDGRRYEILDGELFVTPSPSRAHQEVSGNLFVILRAYVRGRNPGKVFIAPFDVIWLVDPDARTGEAFELAEGRYQRTAHLAGEGTFTSPLFPDLTISLPALWG